jgi:hypothetical protein
MTPQVEVELMHFLLDWRKLKSGGLWTPGGTVLLGRKDDRDEDGGSEMKKKTAGLEWVLRTSVPDKR